MTFLFHLQIAKEKGMAISNFGVSAKMVYMGNMTLKYKVYLYISDTHFESLENTGYTYYIGVDLRKTDLYCKRVISFSVNDQI